MSYLKHNSWGRTRRPKNPAGDGTAVAVTTISALTALDIAGTGSNATIANKVYKTENQRYMHLHCSGSNANVTNVYTYLYAAQQWSELKVRDNANGVMVGTPIVCAVNQHVIVEIGGADLVAIAGADSVYMAFSTF